MTPFGGATVMQKENASVENQILAFYWVPDTVRLTRILNGMP